MRVVFVERGGGGKGQTLNMISGLVTQLRVCDPGRLSFQRREHECRMLDGMSVDASVMAMRRLIYDSQCRSHNIAKAAVSVSGREKLASVELLHALKDLDNGDELLAPYVRTIDSLLFMLGHGNSSTRNRATVLIQVRVARRRRDRRCAARAATCASTAGWQAFAYSAAAPTHPPLPSPRRTRGRGFRGS